MNRGVNQNRNISLWSDMVEYIFADKIILEEKMKHFKEAN
jgi:hypothetical protein